MTGINKVTLVGYLGRDPEIRSTATGDKIATLSLATSETWTDKRTGERRERTEWHRVVIFNTHLVEVVERYCRKGSLIGVEGALQTRKWTGTDGLERYTTEVVLARFRGELTLLGSGNGGGRDSAGAGAAPSRSPAELDDEIPL